MKFLTNLELNQNQLLNARIHVSAVAPTNPVTGQIYYNSSTNKYLGWNGTAWIDLSASSSETTAAAIQEFYLQYNSASSPKLKDNNGTLNVVNNAGTTNANLKVAGFEAAGSTKLGSSLGHSHTIKGTVSAQNNYSFADVQAAVDAAIANWKAANPNFTSKQLNAYRLNPKSAGVGKSLEADVASYVDVFNLKDKDGNSIFQVKPNGDTLIAGILSVNNAGESYFEGNVNINGSLVVEEDATIKGVMSGEDLTLKGNLVVEGNTTVGNDIKSDQMRIKSKVTMDTTGVTSGNVFEIFNNNGSTRQDMLVVNHEGDVTIGGNLTVTKDATIQGVMSGDDLSLRGNLAVAGNTTLGDNVQQDSTVIKGKATIESKHSKANVNAALAQAKLDTYSNWKTISGNANKTMAEYQAAKQAFTGGGYSDPAFAIKDVNGKDNLFEVRGNGDTIIAGVVTVNGDGDSHFAGNVNIGGSLVVDGTIENGTDVNLGEDLIVEGVLRVKGDTYLGDNINQDMLNIQAKTRIDVTGISGAADQKVFQVVNGSKELFTIDSEGDVKVGGSLEISKDAIVNASMAGKDLTLDGNLVVKGNTTLGNGAEDTFRVNAGSVHLGGVRIQGGATPTAASDLVTKEYADSLRAGISVKDPVRVATTQNLAATYNANVLTASVNGVLTIDGKTLSANERVLVKNQTNKTQNGIYVVSNAGSSTAPWTLTRATDATQGKLVSGTAVWVNEGSVNGDTRWVLGTDGAITLGTTDLNFVKDFQMQDITVASGELTKSGNTLGLAASGVTAGTYTSVTVDAKGRVIKGQNLSSSGVTGALGYTPAQKKTFSIGDGSKTEFTFTHNLGTYDLTATVREASGSRQVVYTDIEFPSENTVKVMFSKAPTSGQFSITVVG